jgi:cytochrome c oxidase subunit 4
MLQRSIARLATTTSSFAVRRPAGLPKTSRIGCQQQRKAHAISNPTLANIEKRWEAMPPQEQAELWMALRERMKVDWKEMTFQEKKACMLHYYNSIKFSMQHT